MKNRGIFILATLSILFLSARREKTTIYNLQYVEENMNYIPKCSFTSGNSDGFGVFIDTDTLDKARIVSVDSFYMCRFEMTNGMYCYYLNELQKEKVDTAIYHKALPDTLVWRDKLTYNEPYVFYYLHHPAYADYPLVGISYEQAISFCEWLTKKYNSWPQRKYKNVKFDLPTKDQWEAAARGGLALSPYPWGGPYLQNFKGEWLANFRVIYQGSIVRDTVDYIDVHGKTAKQMLLVGDGGREGYAGMLNAADITSPVKSFYPNDYGLYNMAGNVEEMVKEKGITKGGSWHDTGYYLRNDVEENYTDSTATSSERGFRIMMTMEK